MTARNATARQRDVLRAIVEHIEEHGRPPTIRWLCGRLDISSPNGIVAHLEGLRKKGLLRRGEKTARGNLPVGARLGLVFDDSAAGRRLRAELELEGDDEGGVDRGGR